MSGPGEFAEGSMPKKLGERKHSRHDETFTALDLPSMEMCSRVGCPQLWGEEEDNHGPSAERGLPAAFFISRDL
jgi:hypothetical protein